VAGRDGPIADPDGGRRVEVMRAEIQVVLRAETGQAGVDQE
jgi:hypothetical protein